jgi:hypothetical protein
LLPKALAEIVISHIENFKYKNKKSHRYSEEVKKFCLSIHFISPIAYRFLEQYMSLPSKSTLERITRNWPPGSGIHEILFNALKLKLNHLPEMAKNCVICLDEISLKTDLQYNKRKGEIIGLEDNGIQKTKLTAKYAIAVMVRGITHNYKHLVGYYLVHLPCSARNLKQIVYQCVNELLRINMKPRLVVSDQGSNFIGLSKLLGCSDCAPYFFVKKLKLYYMYDSPHLIKSFRNNFIKYDIQFKEDKLAKWSDVKQLYEYEKNHAFKMAHKLTNYTNS